MCGTTKFLADELRVLVIASARLYSYIAIAIYSLRTRLAETPPFPGEQLSHGLSSLARPVHSAPVADGDQKRLSLDLDEEGKAKDGWIILPDSVSSVLLRHLITPVKILGWW